MSNTLAFKRPVRRRGPERPQYAEADTAKRLADWEPLHEIAGTLPHWQPGDPGRPPEFPPAMVLLFAAMQWGWDSERKVERQLRHKATWEAIRRPMFRRYPEYSGLRPGHAAMSRFQYRRYRDA